MQYDADYSFWNSEIYRYASEIDFVTNFSKDGIHSISLAELPLDILVRNSALVNQANYIVVGFNGSFDRGEKKPPFFVLSSIADKTELPLISFSDPTLALDAKITLGWYSGNQFYPDLPDLIARILDAIVINYQKNLLLVGGSGGGFAALNIQSRMKEKARTITFAWNPQTDLPAFSEILFARYINVGFPIDGIDLTSSQSKPVLSSHSAKVITSKIRKDDTCKALILLDGYDVFHLKDHLRPYFWADESYAFKNQLVFGNQTLVIGDWGLEGDGHCRPSREMAAAVISEIAKKGTIHHLHSLEEATIHGRELFIKGRSRTESKIKLFFNFADDILCLESNVSEYFHGYLAKFALYYQDHSEPIFQTYHISNTVRTKTFVRLKKEHLDNTRLLHAELQIDDFYGQRLVITARATNPSTKRYRINSTL